MTAFNPRTAIVYFDLHFSEDNYEEDKELAKDPQNEGNADNIRRFVALGNDEGMAAHEAEIKAMAEILQMIAEFQKEKYGDDEVNRGLSRLSTEGHDEYDNLICKIPVYNIQEVRDIFEFVQRRSGGGEDEIYLDHYMQAGQFRLYPDGVNDKSYSLKGHCYNGDIEEWLEEQG